MIHGLILKEWLRFRLSLVYLYMTSIQIKAEIDKLLDEIPESELQGVLSLLQEIKAQSAENAPLAAIIKKIITEDKELLRKLAE
jgi:hypothetical protein